MLSENAFSPYIRILGKGKTGSRSLNFEEAKDAMHLILDDKVEHVQIGAFLMLLRVKEESSEELAGFVSACREHINQSNRKSRNTTNKISYVDLDWSSYAGKRRQPHWFILAALLLSENGYRIFMHGAKGHTEGRVYTEEICQSLGLPICNNFEDVDNALEGSHFAFMPISRLCPKLHELINLRPLFGLRSPVHTLCRLLNPMTSDASLQSVFHPAYADTHHLAASLLNETNAIVFKGEAGEVEYRPQARIKLKAIIAQKEKEILIEKKMSAPTNMPPTPEILMNFWKNEDVENTNNDYKEYAKAAILGTAAIGLMVIKSSVNYQEALAQVTLYWNDRDKQKF